MGRLESGRPSSGARIWGWLGVVALLPVGCRTFAKYEPAPLAALEPASLRLKATEFVPIAPHPLTLQEAIQEALTRGPALKGAAEVVAQARADLTTASLFPNPQLSAGTTLQKLGGRFTPNDPGGPPQYNIDLAQPLDAILFGKRTAAINSPPTPLHLPRPTFRPARPRTSRSSRASPRISAPTSAPSSGRSRVGRPRGARSNAKAFRHCRRRSVTSISASNPSEGPIRTSGKRPSP